MCASGLELRFARYHKVLLSLHVPLNQSTLHLNTSTGQVVEKFNRLDRGGTAPSPQWYNMYGAPEFADAGIVSAAVHVANGAFTREIDYVVSLLWCVL